MNLPCIEKMKQNEFVLGTMLSELSSPNLALMFASCGFDYFIIDCEHGYFDYAAVAALTTIATGADLMTMVRIPNSDRKEIVKYLDMGAKALLLPMTSTRQQAETLVQFGKYAPMGNRGISTQRAHTKYSPPPLETYMKQANENTLLFPQIETREGVANIQDIISVEGVAGVFIGPNDLAGDLGTPGILDTAEMEQAISTVLSAAKAAGKPCGIISSKIDLLNHWREQGMNMLSYNSEVGMLLQTGKDAVKRFR